MRPVPEKRIYNFERMGFGLFVHYGLYALIGHGEWYLDTRKISLPEYETLTKRFTAENFSGEALARMASEAGARYITITTRHHDGFSLYDTKGLSDYDAPHSAAGRDLIYDFVNGCNKYGIMPMFYHTTLDWRHPLFNSDFHGYLQYLRDSVKVLCTQYGKIGGLWFDGNWSKPGEDWEEDALYGMIRKCQPDAMIINNTGLNARGETGNIEIDSVTFERGRPFSINGDGARKYLAGEMCQILNSHWGYAEEDFSYRGPEQFIRELAECRKFGANYLLNIGPEGDGSVRLIDRGIFDIIGRWTKIYGESLYNVRPAEGVTASGDSFVLKSDRQGEYFLFVPGLAVLGSGNVMFAAEHTVPVDVRGFAGCVREIEWLDSGEKLHFTQDGENLKIDATQYEYGVNHVVRVARILV